MLLFCGSISTTSGLLWLWPAVALACCGSGLLGRRCRLEVAETGEFGLSKFAASSSFHPTKSPEKRARTSQHNPLGFKVRVYPNVQRACLTPNYSVGLTVNQCSALSTSMAPPPLVPTISPPTVYVMDIPTTPQPGTEFPDPATRVHLSFINNFSTPFACTSFSPTCSRRRISSQTNVGPTKSWTLWSTKDE